MESTAISRPRSQVHPTLRADVIVFAGRNASLDGVHRQLADLGLAAHAARSPAEVIWLLEAGVPRFAAILIDGDGASEDWLELLAHVRATYPTLPMFMMLAAPREAEIDGCLVVDKKRLGEQLMPVLEPAR